MKFVADGYFAEPGTSMVMVGRDSKLRKVQRIPDLMAKYGLLAQAWHGRGTSASRLRVMGVYGGGSRQVDREVLTDTEDAGPARPTGPGFLAAGNQAIGRMLGVIGEVGQGLLGSELRASVGAGGVNLPGDVLIVARLLGMPDDLNAAIVHFQKDVMGWPTPDGRVDPGGRTFAALHHHQAAPTAPTAAPTPTAAPVQDHPATGVELWPSILPTAKRDAKTAITQKPGEGNVTIPEIAVPDLTPEQKTLVEQLKANRDALPEYAIKKAGTSGMVLGDSGAGEKLTPTELKGDGTDAATRAKKVAYKELGHEGTVDAINTYDDQILTWGKGFSALSGSMNEVLMLMFQADPEARHELLRAGIDCDAKSWRVVNTDTGMIETGANALRLMQFDTKLLGVFVTLGRAPQHQQHALDAQWTAMEKHAAHVPEYAYSWPESAIALCAHLAHWAPAFGWGSHPGRYQGTNGDLAQIAGVFTRLASDNHKWTTKLHNGAIVGPFDIMRPGHRLHAFADGAGAAAVESASEVITGTRDEIGGDDQYAGHVLFPVWGRKNAYYDLGSAGS